MTRPLFDDSVKEKELSAGCFMKMYRELPTGEKTGLEEAGRLARYRCFTKVCEGAGGGKIALAHHQDDLAETMLHHLVGNRRRSGSLQPEAGIRQSDPAVTLSGKRRDSGISGRGRTVLENRQQ